MDTTEITHISLCTGYGGIDLGLRRVLPNLRTIAYSEIEAFAIECLLARMEGGQLDPAPIWSDLKSFPWAEFSGKVDILTGGYPCQPFSAAGKRLGAEDPRHLWPYIADGIRILKPRVCFFENVEGHITLGLSTVISDLEDLGYKVSWGIFSASECGAPHQRKRVFIMAHRNSERGQLSNWWKQSTEQMSIGNGEAWRDVWPSRPGEPQHDWEPPRVVADAKSCMSWIKAERQRRESTGRGSKKVMGNSESGARFGRASREEGHAAQPDESVGNANGAGSQEWTRQRGAGVQRVNSDGRTDADRQAQPAMGGDADGAASGLDYAELSVSCDNRTDELRLLGNGVVPATAELAFRTLLKQL